MSQKEEMKISLKTYLDNLFEKNGIFHKVFTSCLPVFYSSSKRNCNIVNKVMGIFL